MEEKNQSSGTLHQQALWLLFVLSIDLFPLLILQVLGVKMLLVVFDDLKVVLLRMGTISV